MRSLYKCWIIIVLVVGYSENLSAQSSDTTKFNLVAGAQGRIQTGNLNQVALGGQMSALVKNSRFSAELSSLYNYAKIEDFVPVNDLWTYAMFKLNPNKRLYPFAIGLYGFSESFAITQSLVGGAGVGLNVIKASKSSQGKHFQINLYGSYLDFNYQDLEAQRSPAGGLLTRLALPLLHNRLNISWEFHGYLAIQDTDLHGFQNQVMLQIPLTRQLSFTINHTVFYGGIVNPGKEQTNQFTLFGGNFRTQR